MKKMRNELLADLDKRATEYRKEKCKQLMDACICQVNGAANKGKNSTQVNCTLVYDFFITKDIKSVIKQLEEKGLYSIMYYDVDDDIILKIVWNCKYPKLELFLSKYCAILFLLFFLIIIIIMSILLLII